MAIKWDPTTWGLPARDMKHDGGRPAIPPAPITENILTLWDLRFDTFEIAQKLGVTEAEAVRALHAGLEARRNERTNEPVLGRQAAPGSAPRESARPRIIPPDLGGRALDPQATDAATWAAAAAAVLDRSRC